MAAKPDLASMANALRALAMDAVEQANSGHPGMPMGMADVAAVLFARYLRYDAGAPDWPDRDRFVLSAGHGSMLLYGLLHLTGYPGMDMGEIERFRQLGSATPGHPEYGHSPGVETTTGPLGQGLATAVGMGIAERAMNAAFGDRLVDHRCWAIASDGDMMEGVSHEAAGLAGHLRLGRLIVLYDDNGISIDGPTALAMSDDPARRFEACGWHTTACDGHDADDIARAIDAALGDPRPSLVSCRTTIARGAPNKAGTAASHGAPLGAGEIAAAREALGWPHPAFVIPDDIAAAWREAGMRGTTAREAWQGRLEASADRAEFERRTSGALPAGFDAAMAEYKADLLADPPRIATRQASQRALGAVNAVLPETVGGSADLTGSNGTLTPGLEPYSADNYGGRYLHYGVREHGMAAAMNGMALHGGLIPYGATFLTFTDYCRPSIRLAALMGVRSIFVMTHDSIGLGEDGPTHQPIEHLASLRAMPGLVTMRPADAMETAECWEDRALAEGAVRACAHAPGRARCPHRAGCGKPVGARRLCACRFRRRAGGGADRDRLRSRGRAGGEGGARRIGRAGARGLDAVHGAVRAPGRGLSRPRAAGGAGARRGRGGCVLRLGPPCRAGRGGRRNRRLRRLGSGAGAV